MIDLGLRNKDALDLIHDLRGLPNISDIPILMICCCAEDGTVSVPTNTPSIVNWIYKPISQYKLQQALHTAILKDVAVEYRFDITIANVRLFLKSQEFDLVILDLTLPDGSGIDLLNELKDSCPVMVFSDDDVHDGLSKQVAAALTKSMTNND